MIGDLSQKQIAELIEEERHNLEEQSRGVNRARRLIGVLKQVTANVENEFKKFDTGKLAKAYEDPENALLTKHLPDVLKPLLSMLRTAARSGLAVKLREDRDLDKEKKYGLEEEKRERKQLDEVRIKKAIVRNYYDIWGDHAPAAVAKKFLDAFLKKVRKVAKGTKVEPVEVRSTGPRGWDGGVIVSAKVIPKDGESFDMFFKLSWVRDEQYSGYTQVGKSGRILTAPRTSTLDKAISYHVDNAAGWAREGKE